MEILKAVLGWLQKPTLRIGGMILLTACATLGLLRTNLPSAAIKTAVRPYEGWIWLALLASSSLLATYAIEAAWKAGLRHLRQRDATKRRIARLHDLTLEERHTLQPFLENAARTRGGHPEDRVAVSLVRDGILIHVTQFAFRISEDVWRYLLEHPNLVATPDNPRPPLTGHEWMRH